MEAVEILKREHRIVLLVAAAARRDLEVTGEAHAIAADEAERLLHYFRYFTNACHDPKEEDLLFTALHRRGMSWDDFPLRELVREHQEMRIILDSASDWLTLLRAGDATAMIPLAYDLKAYIDLLERHIAAEEEAIFPMVHELLTVHDLEALRDEFAAIACEELEEGVHAYYSDLAFELAGTAH